MMKKLFALLALGMFSVFANAASPHIADISQTELKAVVASKSAVLLDVNGSDSYKRSEEHTSELQSLV